MIKDGKNFPQKIHQSAIVIESKQKHVKGNKVVLFSVDATGLLFFKVIFIAFFPHQLLMGSTC